MHMRESKVLRWALENYEKAADGASERSFSFLWTVLQRHADRQLKGRIRHDLAPVCCLARPCGPWRPGEEADLLVLQRRQLQERQRVQHQPRFASR